YAVLVETAFDETGDGDGRAAPTMSVAGRAGGAEPDDAATSVGLATSGGGRFRVLRLHDRGGLGEVFVARDEEVRREVALKRIQDRYAADGYKRTRFLVEPETTGRLEHPGVVPVYGLGQYADGRPFYA